jgi:superfamily II DNA/RNA helicase
LNSQLPTGRAGAKGEALTLLTPDDSTHAQALVEILTETKQEVPEALVAMAKAKENESVFSDGLSFKHFKHFEPFEPSKPFKTFKHFEPFEPFEPFKPFAL